jgi:uncharacterized hydrophobic protein (TIGR00271 family)
MPDPDPPLPPPRWFERIVGPFPTLDREDRVDLLERLQAGATGGADFNVMMILAAALASLGLLQGSTAVVIGAMLVAPLMGPLLAAGLALVQGNLRLFRSAMAVGGLGIGLALGVSLLIGAMNPGFEPSMEIEARGTPDLMDLGIAFASGMAAAYASGRPNVASTLAGVAIAAALVPPLAVVGVALTNDRAFISGNAAILLITNLVAIILGAAVVFRALGVQSSLAGSGMPTWARQATVLLLLSLVLLTAPLLLQMLETRRTGQMRPLNYPAAPHVREAVRDFVEDRPGVTLISVSRISVEPEAGIIIVVASEGELTRAFEKEIEAVVQRARGDESPVRLFALRSALETPAQPPKEP